MKAKFDTNVYIYESKIQHKCIYKKKKCTYPSLSRGLGKKNPHKCFLQHTHKHTHIYYIHHTYNNRCVI